jgi:hypothetical protein
MRASLAPEVAVRRLLPLSFLALAAAAAIAPGMVRADTVYTFNLASTSDLAGAASGSPSGFCAPGATCPSNATYALGANVPVTGTISIDTTTSQMTFDLVLGQNATFSSTSSGSLTLDSGSSFVAGSSAPIGVSVSSSTKKGVTTDTVLPGTGTYTALSSLVLPTGVTQTENQPIVSGLDCSFIVGSSGSCAFVLGSPDTGASNILQVNNGSPYNGVLSFNLNMTPVPLPASVWLLLGSLGGFIAFRRRAS